MEYTIKQVDAAQGWVKLDIKYDDGSTETKRVMVPLDGDEAAHAAIQTWLAERVAVRASDADAFDPTTLVNKKTTVSAAALSDLKAARDA